MACHPFDNRRKDTGQFGHVHAWKLNPDELDRFQTGQVCDYLKCPLSIVSPVPNPNNGPPTETETVALKWYMWVFPLGHNISNAGDTQLTLFTKSIPSNLRSVFMNY